MVRSAQTGSGTTIISEHRIGFHFEVLFDVRKEQLAFLIFGSAAVNRKTFVTSLVGKKVIRLFCNVVRYYIHREGGVSDF